MINAIITHKDETLIVKFLMELYQLYRELNGIGVNKAP